MLQNLSSFLREVLLLFWWPYFKFSKFHRCKSIFFFLFFSLPFSSRLPRRQGSILYCTTGIILQWLRSDPWVCFHLCLLILYTSFPCKSSLLFPLYLHSSHPLFVTLFCPHWFGVDATVCGRFISMGPHFLLTHSSMLVFAF